MMMVMILLIETSIEIHKPVKQLSRRRSICSDDTCYCTVYPRDAARTVQTRYRVHGKGHLNEQGGFLVTKSLTLFSAVRSTLSINPKGFFEDISYDPSWSIPTKMTLPWCINVVCSFSVSQTMNALFFVHRLSCCLRITEVSKSARASHILGHLNLDYVDFITFRFLKLKHIN